MKTVFFDTEFTTINFGEPPYLMSIGCVTEDGREFYAELSDTWHVNLCSRFVRQTVIPLLQGGEFCITEAELAVRLKEWIEGLSDEEVILRSDSPMYDWQWVERLFKDYGWPKNLLQKCGTIYFDDDDQISHYQDGIEIFWKENSARQHHALVDAKSLLFAWKHALQRSAKITATGTGYRADLGDSQHIEADEIRELAGKLHKAGVSVDSAHCADWREGDIAPGAGAAIALKVELRKLEGAK